jgi:hypothetical protein
MAKQRLQPTDVARRRGPSVSNPRPDRQAWRDEVLALHQTIGNRAVARLFEPAPALSALPAPGGDVIQRKIGFELETGIPITTKFKGGKYRNPSHSWNEPVLGNHKLTVDSAPGHTKTDAGDFDNWPIIEFVSAPVEDDEDLGVFGAEASKWVTLLTQLRGLHDGTPPPKNLNVVVPSAKATRKVGFVDNQTKMGDRGPNDVSVQYTFGARLSRMNEVFQALSKIDRERGGTRALFEKADALTTASSNVAHFMPALTKKVPTHSSGMFEKKSKKQAKKQQGDANLPDVQGFLQLVSAYLVAGNTVSSRGYVKNRVQLFFKSKLSSVREDIVGDNPYAAALLTDDANRAWLKRKLIEINGRTGAEAAFLGIDNPTVSDWLDEVLEGRDDSIFELARNPWSEEIKPGTVRGEHAAVMEMRSPGTVFTEDARFDVVSEPDAIVNYLMRLFAANQQVQELDS